MADQCIVCLEPLDVEANTTPLSPAVQELVRELKAQHERLAVEDPDALAKINQTHASAPVNHEHVATISACGHTLHDNCLREWSEKANSCPICRQTFHLVTVYEKVGGEFATQTECTPLLPGRLELTWSVFARQVLVDPPSRGQEAGTRVRPASICR